MRQGVAQDRAGLARQLRKAGTPSRSPRRKRERGARRDCAGISRPAPGYGRWADANTSCHGPDIVRIPAKLDIALLPAHQPVRQLFGMIAHAQHRHALPGKPARQPFTEDRAARVLVGGRLDAPAPARNARWRGEAESAAVLHGPCTGFPPAEPSADAHLAHSALARSGFRAGDALCHAGELSGASAGAPAYPRIVTPDRTIHRE